MKIEPAGDRLMILLSKPETESEGGIEIPEDAQKDPTFGLVLKAGPGKIMSDGLRGPMQAAKGDTVFFAPYTGSKLEIEGQNVLVLSDAELLLVGKKE